MRLVVLSVFVSFSVRLPYLAICLSSFQLTVCVGVRVFILLTYLSFLAVSMSV